MAKNNSNIDPIEEQEKAFQYYFSLGSDRTHSKVRREFGKSPATISRWAKKGDWEGRIERLEEKITEKNDDRMMKAKITNLESMDRFLFILMSDAYEAMKSGRIKIKSIADVERIANLILKIHNPEDAKGSQIADNIAILSETLKSSGFDNIPDPDRDENQDEQQSH